MNFEPITKNIEKIKENNEKKQILKLIRTRDFSKVGDFFRKHKNVSRKNADLLFKKMCKYDVDSFYFHYFFSGYGDLDYTIEKIPVIYKKLNKDNSDSEYAQEKLVRIFDFCENSKEIYEELIKFGISEHLNYLLSYVMFWKSCGVNNESIVLLIENLNMANSFNCFYELREQVNKRFSENEELKKKYIKQINDNLVIFFNKKLKKATSGEELVSLLGDIYLKNRKIDLEANKILTKRFLQIFVGRINCRSFIDRKLEDVIFDYLDIFVNEFLPEDKQAFDDLFKIGINSTRFCERFYKKTKNNYDILSEENKILFKNYVLEKGNENVILEFITKIDDEILIKEKFGNEMNLILYCYRQGKNDILDNYMDSCLIKNKELLNGISKQFNNK